MFTAMKRPVFPRRLRVPAIRGARPPLAAGLALFLTLTAPGSQAAPVDFVREVRPILEKHCYSCHGPEKQKGSLRLDVKAAAFKGGDEHAATIRPGNPKDSPLLIAVLGEDEDLKMPPKGERVSRSEIETLTRWVQEGAVWPDGVDAVSLKDPDRKSVV